MDKILDFLRFVFTLNGSAVLVRTNYTNRPPLTYEITSKETQTEQHGYKTLQQQVADLLLAGERLENYRRGDVYYDTDNLADDFDGDIDDDFSVVSDPTRSPDFTGFDADDALLGIHRDVEDGKKVARTRKSKAKVKSKKSEEEKVDATTESQGDDSQLAGE